MTVLTDHTQVIRDIDKNCGWCKGTGYWHGKPCIKCNPPKRALVDLPGDPADTLALGATLHLPKPLHLPGALTLRALPRRHRGQTPLRLLNGEEPVAAVVGYQNPAFRGRRLVHMTIVDAPQREVAEEEQKRELRVIALPEAVRICPVCDGKKQVYYKDKGWITCPQCGGRGSINS